jgi:hypothetical protein
MDRAVYLGVNKTTGGVAMIDERGVVRCKLQNITHDEIARECGRDMRREHLTLDEMRMVSRLTYATFRASDDPVSSQDAMQAAKARLIDLLRQCDLRSSSSTDECAMLGAADGSSSGADGASESSG